MKLKLTDVELEVPDNLPLDERLLPQRLLSMLGEGFLDQMEAVFGQHPASVTITQGTKITKVSSA